jgi:flagellum-specific peptidoglycan hydrolase FlgJ
MWANESAWGANVSGKNNYFGITRSPESGPAKMCPTTEYLTPAQLQAFRADERATAVPIAGKPVSPDGHRWYSMSRWFASYGTLQEACADYIALFTKSAQRYAPAWQQFLIDHDAEGLLKRLCEAGYATGAAKLVEVQILHQSNIVHAIEMARTELEGGIRAA